MKTVEQMVKEAAQISLRQMTRHGECMPFSHSRALVALVMEECAAMCDVTPPQPFRPSIEAAHAIRAAAKDLK